MYVPPGDNDVPVTLETQQPTPFPPYQAMDEPHVISPDDTPVQPTVAAPRYPQRGLRPAQGLQRPRYALAEALLAAAPPDFLHLANVVINPITIKPLRLQDRKSVRA